MKKINISTLLIIAAAFFPISVVAQTQTDTIYAYMSTEPLLIDGSADEACWAEAEWHAIDQVWIPYGEVMATGDFEGRFKVSWDESFLYLLVEVTDDSLSDDYSNPLEHWWDDDCVEIFVDEDRSMGYHERNNNAFAYHVSLFYDVIDLNSSGNPVNYADHIEVAMDTIADNTYLWEMAIKIYDDSYSASLPENSRVLLYHKKLMGFTLAYCDNDETSGRENFIGSMYMTASTANDNYKTADYFGSLLLIDPEYVAPAGLIISDLSGSTSESGGTATFTVRLSSPVDSNVIVSIVSGNIAEGVVSPSELIFTPENYAVGQTVTVQGIDDDVADGDANYNIILSVNAESDSDYKNIGEYSILITNLDDDVTGLSENKPNRGISLSPNPASTHITVQTPFEGSAYFEIYTLSGTLLQRGPAFFERQHINTSHLVCGPYLLVLHQGDASYRKLFVIQ